MGCFVPNHFHLQNQTPFLETHEAIGAFKFSSYDMDLTPFVGMLLDGKEHVFGIGVARASLISVYFWLSDKA